ncbi:Inner nuclear membrane protein SRC1 [Colletotrichum siamense]|uniref:Inner nuclear membrane protein SRC1 n=1 Tax=Colletotrichum siamense TaxID=690259 RepID=UPI0018732FAF|nr:Inner nuclear membrane protein SRC1 [Colletotrichum siamense]KAF4825544.1 Inner nuclear membrane protein SRC1 [Colletotrichum siamense]KAF5515368.1 Inner nuclear membrane protein SRC1 [Colletotrichum siamense]
MDEYEYLQPGFDPKSLTVPRLRSILVAHEIQYPSTAKKPQLVDLFNEEVLPQAKKILAKQARAKRSSKGIVDMGSNHESESFDDYDLAPPPRRRTTRSQSPRKASTRVKSEEYDQQPPAPISPTKRKVRASSRQPVEPEPYYEPEQVEQLERFEQPVFEQPEPPKSVRTKRNVTPHIKQEESEEDFFKKRRESEYFSMDNPFQSGSSPAPIKTPATGRRRTGQDLFQNDSVRRRTDGHHAEERPKSSRKSQAFEVPVSTLLREDTPEYQPAEIVEAGEEFTPDAQFEMEQEMAASGESALAPRRTPARPRRSLAKPFWALAVSLLGAYGAWYRQEKVAVGYCGLGRPATQIIPADIPVPDWAVQLAEPQCELCPQHAYCYEDFSVRCEPDFILKPHPLALGGLVPLPPTCEPDGEKVRRVKAVADKTVEELRERRAQFECGDSTDEAQQAPEAPAIDEEELKKVISAKRSKKMNKQEFDDLWVAAIGDVKGREEVEVVPKANSTSVSDAYLSSSSLARLPIGCAIKRSFRLGLARHRLSIGSVIVLIVSYFYVRSKYRSHKATVAQVPALVDLVLARLATQKELGEEEIDDPWLFLPNLRDDVLRSVHSLGERDRIWKRVKAVVEQNSNVRTSQREGRSGEVGRAWEWIGPITGDTARRRKSGRISFGAGPDVKTEDTPDAAEKAGAHSKWEESRPIY